MITLEGIWSHLTESSQDDQIKIVLEKQNTSLVYQYQMIFKTITNAESFQDELKEKQNEQTQIDTLRS